MNYFLLDGVIRSQSVLEKSSEAVSEISKTTVKTGGGSMGFLSTVPGIIIYFIVIIAIFYFLAIRPQKKREKQLSAVRNEIKAGDYVLLDSGIYGKVASISDNVFIIEFGTNKGVLIPVLKQRVVSIEEPNISNS